MLLFFILILSLSCKNEIEFDTTSPKNIDSLLVVKPDSLNNPKEQNTAFEGLATLTIDEKWPIKIHYNPETSVIINKNISVYGFQVLQVLKTKIYNQSNDYFVINFSEEPSADPRFSIYKVHQDSLEHISSLKGTELFIPGNGCLYTCGHTDNMFNHRKKYSLSNNDIIETKQPFYFVGIESKTTADVILYENINYKNIVAKLPKGTQVIVLLAQDDNYLFKTPFGLLGWTKIDENSYHGIPIKEIFFNGD